MTFYYLTISPNIKMLNFSYKIKAYLLKIFISFSMLIAIQLGCYSYIAHSDYITFLFIFAAITLIFLFVITLFLLFYCIKYGRPRVHFFTENCQIQILTIQLTFKYSDLLSLNLSKNKIEHRGFTTGYEYDLTFNFRNKISEDNLFKKQKNQVNHFKMDSSYFFTKDQIIQIAIICTALTRMKSVERIEKIQKLQQNFIAYDHLISNKEFENFKNNQYINKSFKFGQ